MFKQAQIKIDAGSIRNRIKTVTSDYTISGYDTVIVDATSNTVTVTLPASPNTSDKYNVVCFDSTYAVDIDFNSNNFYTSSANQKLVKGENLVVMFDGTQWIGG